MGSTRMYHRVAWVCAAALLMAPLAPGVFAADASDATSVTLTLLKRVSISDPLSCAGAAENIHLSTACLGDAGAFQMARLGLAVESLAAAMSAAGMGGSVETIQRTIFADVQSFGPQAALTSPAMNLVDAASVPDSPFGSARSVVAGRSIAALEYLYPGIIPQMHLDYGEVAAMAGLERMAGPFTFSEYVSKSANLPTSMDSYRLFSAPPNTGPVMQKLALPATSNSGYVNPSADFFVPAGPSVVPSLIAPISRVFGEAAMLSATTGTPLKEGSSDAFPKLRPDLSSVPFGGAGCVACAGGPGDVTAGLQLNAPLLGPQPSVESLRQMLTLQTEPKALDPKSPGQGTDGPDFFNATRLSRKKAKSEASSAGEAPTGEDDPTGAEEGGDQAGHSSETARMAKKIGIQVGRKALAAVVGAYYGGRVEKIAKIAGGGAVGAGLSVFFSPTEISCDMGEKCPGKTDEQVAAEKKEIEKATEAPKPQPDKPKDGSKSPDGGATSPADGNKDPKKPKAGGDNPPGGEGNGQTELTMDPDAKPTDAPGGKPDLPPEVLCRTANARNCGCAVNTAGEVGFCVQTDKSDVIAAAVGDHAEGWFVSNQDLDQQRQIFSLESKVDLPQSSATLPTNGTEPTKDQAMTWVPLPADPGPGVEAISAKALAEKLNLGTSPDIQAPDWARQLLEQVPSPQASPQPPGMSP